MIIEEIPLLDCMTNANVTAYLQNLSLDGRLLGSRPAVVICPGGAYIGITEKEAEPVALKFLSYGYQAFILKYSIGAGVASLPTPFEDAARAVMIIRENADKWGIDPNRISLCGFSTGGHVAASFAATWHEDYLAQALNVDNHLFKPNALLLGYPLLDLHKFKIKNMEKSPEMMPMLEMVFSAAFGTPDPAKQHMDEWNCIKRVSIYMPPTFLWMTSSDAYVDVTEGLDFVKALIASKIPYEFHVFKTGAHGLSLGDQTVGYSEVDIISHGNASKWVELAFNWLDKVYD